MRQEYERNQASSHLSIQKLPSLKILKNDNEQELIYIYALILIQNSEYSSNQSIVDSIKKTFLSKTINENILDAYKEIIERTKCQTNHFHSVFDVVIDILNQNDKLTIFHFDILVCIALASEVKKISNLKPLEKNIFNDNEIIRSWSFRGLRAAYEKERFEISEAERFQFYQAWLDIEDNQSYGKGQSDILLKLSHHFLVNNSMRFQKCYETIKILNKIDFETVYRILLSSNDAFVDLRKTYLTVIIKERCLNKNEISRECVEALASRMISKFGFGLSQKFFDALQNINNLREFEDVLNFAEKHEIKISDIYVKNTIISVLKRSLEIKLLGNQFKEIDRLKLGVHLDSLLYQNCTFEQLNHIFSIFKESNSRDKVRYLMCVLEILLYYKILPKQKKNQEKIFVALKNPAEHWQQEINKIAVETIFTDIDRVKTPRELIKEFQDKNFHNKNL
ncbi:unnamed protein product [Rotaria sp. Silwood1]|nr:unnamed protein product [Rotaria sp. Silwood1]